MLEYRLYRFLNPKSMAKYKIVISNHTSDNIGNKERENRITGEIIITCNYHM
jgi:hypothetical protein